MVMQLASVNFLIVLIVRGVSLDIRKERVALDWTPRWVFAEIGFGI